MMNLTATQRVTRALIDASASIVTNVPGFGGTQIFTAYGAEVAHPCTPFFHEEVAFTVAHGASLAGKRSATLIKAHGLAKAANSVVDSLSAGTGAGFVVMVFDDKKGKHSDSVLDTVALLEGLRIPYRIPQIDDIYQEVLDAFVRSEESQLPVALLIDSEALGKEGTVAAGQVDIPQRGFVRNPAQHVLSPLTAGYQDQVLKAKLSFKQWRSLSPPPFPRIPDDLPPEWQEPLRTYQPFFDAFKELRGDIVAGDTGVSSIYCLPPYECIDMCTYMGGSVALALGAYLAGYRDVWAVTGDFSFIAAGHLGLLEAFRRKIPLKIVVFYNHQAQTTGGQDIESGIMETLLEGYKPSMVTIDDPFNSHKIAETLVAVKNSEELQIVVVDYDDQA